MADYDMLGSFSTGGASSLNSELINKLKDAERGSVLYHIDKDLENITGMDADTGDSLDSLGESDRMTIIKAQAFDLLANISTFDLATTETTVFDAVTANTTGSAAVFDAVDIGGLEPGTNNVEITQLAQRDVYQSVSFNGALKDAGLSVISTDGDVGDPTDSEADADLVKSSKISVSVGGTTYDFDIVKDKTPTTVAELSVKTIEELADEINGNEDLIASIENIGTDSYRLVIKSTESGVDNALTITQTNVDLGFGTFESNEILNLGDDIAPDGLLKITEDDGTEHDFITVGKTYNTLISDITSAGFSVTTEDNKIQIKSNDGSNLTIEEFDGLDLGISSMSQTQVAQNLEANIDGIDYDVSSNTLTIQGNLTMTAVELGKATINIEKDTTAILSGVETFIDSYNTLIDLIEEESGDTESPMYDISSLRSLTSSIKEKLFDNYGLNNDQNLFNYGLELDLMGHLSLDTTKFADGLVDNYEDLKNMFLGNTTDEDLALSDDTKYMGMGTLLKSYLDGLDDSDGLINRYEASIASRKEQLEKDREAAIESLDTKYDTLSSQFSMYGSAISSMESAYSGMKMMIEQSLVSN